MAMLAPVNAPVRQPFGMLDSSKIRSLQSMKNRQNAIAPGSNSSLKRRAVSPETSDSENVDPNLLALMSKRKRSTFDDDVSASKPAKYNLTTVSASKPCISTPVSMTSLNTEHKASKTPASAPVGRSPTKSKRPGLLQPRQRFAPPSFGIKSPSLSITAALNGTLATRKPKKVRTLEESKPKSWFFDIFEESEEHQDYRMKEWTMTESATSLDISDDESKANERSDRGKENIDPNEISVTVTRSMTAAAVAKASSLPAKETIMTDEPRTPLGDLNPAEYYAEGLDATSVVLVQNETVTEKVSTAEKTKAIDSVPVQDFTFQASSNLQPQSDLITANIDALIMASTPKWEAPAVVEVKEQAVDDFFASSGDVDIWESESAKDENEKEDQITDGTALALQEL